MAASDTSRVTVSNGPGVWVRKMEATRWLAALFILVILIILFAGMYFYSNGRKGIATLGLPVTLAVAVGVICWVKAMGDKPVEYSRMAVDARRGAVAETTVGTLLDELPAGYSVVHDFVTRRGNIDHVVISKKGILTIETNGDKGVVGCEGEMLKLDGRTFEKDIIKKAWAQAFLIRDLVASHGVTVPIPQPVLLFANADVQVRKQVRGVKIIGRGDLPVYLERRHIRINAKDAEKIFELLKLLQAQMFV